jgi:Fe-S-cluster containining protein
MSPERNEPCPCGSGKKYKKCCGQSGNNWDLDVYQVNQAVAYAGQIGALRLNFCKEYHLFKEMVTAEIGKKQREDTEGKGEKISCIPGCIHCCKTYVFTSLEEAECIVHYLYQHEDALLHFLTEYHETWRHNPVVKQLLPSLNYYQGRSLSVSLSTAEEKQFDEYLAEFVNQSLRCPFLADNDNCTIYEVRPFTCSGIVVTTPTEWCAPNSNNCTKVKQCRVAMKPESNLPYFLKNESSVIYGCLPDIVHNLLAHGYGFLESVLHKEGLRREVMHDPEVANILKALRASMPV